MIQNLFLFIPLLIFISCGANESDFKEVDVPKDQAYVQHQTLDEEAVRMLELNGIQHYGTFNVTLNTKNSNYLPFVAVADLAPNESKSNSYTFQEAVLKDLKYIGNCNFFMDLVRDSTENFYVSESRSFEFFQHLAMPSLLGNDSIYLSTNAIEYFTLGREYSAVHFDNSIRFSDKFYHQDNVIPFIHGYARLASRGMGNDTMSSVLIGLISYDCDANIDINSFFNDSNFAATVFRPLSTINNPRTNFKVSNYAIKD
jgi:hypothetical protein